MIQFLSINLFSLISSIFVGVFKIFFLFFYFCICVHRKLAHNLALERRGGDYEVRMDAASIPAASFSKNIALVSYLSTSRDDGFSCCYFVAYSAASVRSKKYAGWAEVQPHSFLATD